MNDEFNNRIAAQRRIVDAINRNYSRTEDLFGLSRKAIDRWVSVNQNDSQSRLVQLMVTASAKLFFLANKSQEQVSAEYRAAAEDVEFVAREIEDELLTANTATSAGAGTVERHDLIRPLISKDTSETTR
jgi:hypothetical protein